LNFISEFAGQEFVSGPGTFRSANRLATDKDQFKFKLDYQLGDHLITAGYEYETLDVFNLFIINATGTVTFDGVAGLDSGIADQIKMGVSYTRDPNDAAAIYTRDIHSFFIQDKWDISDSAELIFGVRFDEYRSDDLPILNDNFVLRYGITNQVGFDGLDAIQPRVGFNYTLPDSWGDTRMSLGFGVFSGNDPTVWFSNAYQNFGGALGVGTLDACTNGEENVLAGGSFSGIPDCVIAAGQAQAQATLGAVNATDPKLDLPTVHRFSFGMEHNTSFENDFLSDWNLRLDVIYADLKNQVDFLDLSLHQIGSTPDGRPIYDQVDPLRAGCNASFNGPRLGYRGVTDECFGANSDIWFTNQPGDGGKTFTTSIQASKLFEWGSGWQANVSAGYSYNESEVGNPGNSFTAAGNFRSVVNENLGFAPIGPSYRNTPHNFVLAATFSKAFFGDNVTSMTAFFQRRKGGPLSPVYFNDSYNGAIGDPAGEARHLIYVPTDENDPLVTWTDGSASAFFSWADDVGLKRGAIANKGAIDEPWQSDLDIRFQQEIPFFGGAKGKFYLDIENVLNLLNDEWGAKNYINTIDILSAVAIVDADINPTTNQYEYSDFSKPRTSPDSWDSLYRIQLGIRVDF
jgi:hypothetical protein